MCVRVCSSSKNIVSYTFDCNEKCIKFKRRLHIGFIWITKKITFRQYTWCRIFSLLHCTWMKRVRILFCDRIDVTVCMRLLIWTYHERSWNANKWRRDRSNIMNERMNDSCHYRRTRCTIQTWTREYHSLRFQMVLNRPWCIRFFLLSNVVSLSPLFSVVQATALHPCVCFAIMNCECIHPY